MGVLVAISIPIFTGQLQKARFGTNQANARSALSAATSDWLATDDKTKSDTWYKISANLVYFTYDCSTGNLTGDPTTTDPVGTEVTTSTTSGSTTTTSSAATISSWTLKDISALGDKTYSTWIIGIDKDGQAKKVEYE